MKPLIIRADASPEIGTGHVMRCLALAEAWQDTGGEVFFVSAYSATIIEDRLKKEGMPVLHIRQEAGSLGDADETARIAYDRGADWIVVDGYQFGAAYQKTIKDSRLSLLFIDDYGHADHYYADLVLNQNIYADKSLYPKHEPYTRFLLGTKYALLRKEFLPWAEHKRTIPKVARKILVTLGGSDPQNVTGTVIRALKQLPSEELEVIIILGSLNFHFAQVQELIRGNSNFSIRSNAGNMPELMAWADVAISAGGTTCWELAFMGVPSILFPIAENQKPNVTSLQAKGIIKCINLKEISEPDTILHTIRELLLSRHERSVLSHKMKELIPQEGSLCVTLLMDKTGLKLRPGALQDCEFVWELANDPDVRRAAFHQNKIPWNSHKKWFAAKINDPHSSIFLLTTAKKKLLGQIRFDTTNGETEVDISIDQKFRGCGLGSYLISEGVKIFIKRNPQLKINAYVKDNNMASIQAFKKAGFKWIREDIRYGCKVVHLIWEKE